MADIDAAEFLEDTEQTHTGDTVYTTALDVVDTNWVANAKYLVMMTARINHDNANGLGGWIMEREDGGVITHSEFIAEEVRHYEWWGIYDAPATAEGVRFQHKVLVDSDTVSSDSMALIKIRLDDDLTENTDWRFNENTTKSLPSPETTYTTFAAIASYTPGTPADSRLILALIRVEATSASRSYEWHLEENVNGGGFVEVAGSGFQEPEDPANEMLHVVVWEDDSGTAGTREYRVQMRNEDDNANHEHIYSSIFVLEKNAFASEDVNKNTTPLTGDAGTQILNAIAD